MELTEYEDMVQLALISVVRDVLIQASSGNFGSSKHFYIGFRSDFKSVKISDALRTKYPKEMMVRIDNKAFGSMRVFEKSFFVTLLFSGYPEKMEIPFSALTTFADPVVHFGLEFIPTDVIHPQHDDDDDNGDDKFISFDKFKK